MMGTSQRDLPCFKRGFDTTIGELKDRLTPQGPKKKLSQKECTVFVDDLIKGALSSWATGIYDSF